ncbi:hypothetical protein ACW7G0_07345 [Lysobacter sp. A286]
MYTVTLSRLIATTAARRAAVLAVPLLFAGCIGGQDHAEIRAEALQRGGGAEPFLVREAEAAVAARLSAEAGTLVLASISIAPDHLALVAADPRTPGNWDRYRYASGRLGEPRPVRARPGAAAGFRLGEFRALDRLPTLVADARARIGFAEGQLGTVEIKPAANPNADEGRRPGPRLWVRLTDPRRGTAAQQYDAEGRPL